MARLPISLPQEAESTPISKGRMLSHDLDICLNVIVCYQAALALVKEALPSDITEKHPAFRAAFKSVEEGNALLQECTSFKITGKSVVSDEG